MPPTMRQPAGQGRDRPLGRRDLRARHPAAGRGGPRWGAPRHRRGQRQLGHRRRASRRSRTGCGPSIPRRSTSTESGSGIGRSPASGAALRRGRIDWWRAQSPPCGPRVRRVSRCPMRQPAGPAKRRPGWADEIYERDIRREVEADHHGEVVAIDVDSGEWAIGEEVLEATDRLRVQRPRPPSMCCVSGLVTGRCSQLRGPFPAERRVIEGVVSATYEPIVALVVQGPSGHTRETEAVVDTGYNGFLTLPAGLVTELGLPLAKHRVGGLGRWLRDQLRRSLRSRCCGTVIRDTSASM